MTKKLEEKQLEKVSGGIGTVSPQSPLNIGGQQGEQIAVDPYGSWSSGT